MTRLSGRVPETGTAISGATVAIIDTQGTDDTTQWSIVASTTTDANGEWSVSGLAPSAVERYHAVAQYDSGTEFVNFESLPYLSTPADAFAPTTSVNVGTPTASVSVGSAIPDADLLQYLIDEGSGTTLTDSVGTNDATVSDGTWVSDPDYIGGFGIDMSGSSTSQITANPIPEITKSNDWTVGITIRAETSLDAGNVIFDHTTTADSDDAFAIGNSDVDGSFIGASAYISGSDVSNVTHPEPSAPYLIRLHLTYDSGTQEVELYLDNTASTGSVDNVNHYVISEGLSIGADNDGGRNADIIVGDVTGWNRILNSEERQTDLENQPWYSSGN